MGRLVWKKSVYRTEVSNGWTNEKAIITLGRDRCMKSYICEHCGVEVFVGDWPFCNHGSVVPREHFKEQYNYSLDAVVSSAKEVDKILKDNNAAPQNHPCGMPGCWI